jgi:hypothetical protein
MPDQGHGLYLVKIGVIEEVRYSEALEGRAN